MDKVFITHSRHDAPILAGVRQLVEDAGVEPIFYQYEYDHITTAWQEIRDAIRISRALFVVLSNNLSSSAHTQNWVGLEVGIACSFNKRVWVFEELHRSASFPIPYLTDYVPYDLSDPGLRELIWAVARGYKLQPQSLSTVGGAALGGLLFGWPGLVAGAIIGNLVSRPQKAPYVNLLCYHLDCKTRFRTYVWLNQLECPACRRTLRFRLETLPDGSSVIYPDPYRNELCYPHYVWYDPVGNLQFYEC